MNDAVPGSGMDRACPNSGRVYPIHLRRGPSHAIAESVQNDGKVWWQKDKYGE